MVANVIMAVFLQVVVVICNYSSDSCHSVGQYFTGVVVFVADNAHSSTLNYKPITLALLGGFSNQNILWKYDRKSRKHVTRTISQFQGER